MDVSFLYLRPFAETPSRVREYLGDLDLMMLTHDHGDHLENETVRALADTGITWMAPDFLVGKLLRLGVREERIVAVKAGDSLAVGPLQVRVLPGRHIRPEDGRGLASVGYRVTADGAPSLIFPGDVRDYRVEGTDAADYCFAHVWLTDEATMPEKYLPKSEEFAEFMLSLSRRTVFLTHLYTNREITKLWTMHHARVAADAIRRRSPETTVCVPRYGEIFTLTP
jgi:L-ascorbate metabolism protein UlaG (beta-lactamase superfamily)